MVFLIEPFHRMFYINDLHIAFPHAEIERVPVCTLPLFAPNSPVVDHRS